MIHQLKQKGLLRIDRQTRHNGGTRQNLYTLLSVSEQEQENGKTVQTNSMTDLRWRAERAKNFVAEIMKQFPMVYSRKFIQRE